MGFNSGFKGLIIYACILGIYLIHSTFSSPVCKITSDMGTLCCRLNSFPCNSIPTTGCNVQGSCPGRIFNLIGILMECDIGEEMCKKCVDFIFFHVGPLFIVLYVDLKCHLSE